MTFNLKRLSLILSLMRLLSRYTNILMAMYSAKILQKKKRKRKKNSKSLLCLDIKICQQNVSAADVRIKSKMRQQQQQTPAKKNSCSHRSKSRCNVWIVHTSTLFYKKNILSIRWLHLTILIALFYFIYLNQLHHFLLYRNFHTLFFLFFSLTNPTIPRINCFFSFASTAMNLSLPLLMCVSVFFSAKAFRFRTQDIPFIFIFIWFISLWWINKGDDKEKRRQRKLRATDRSIALLIQRPTGMYVGVSNKGNVKKESKKKKEHNGGTFCEEWRWTKL